MRFVEKSIGLSMFHHLENMAHIIFPSYHHTKQLQSEILEEAILSVPLPITDLSKTDEVSPGHSTPKDTNAIDTGVS